MWNIFIYILFKIVFFTLVCSENSFGVLGFFRCDHLLKQKKKTCLLYYYQTDIGYSHDHKHFYIQVH